MQDTAYAAIRTGMAQWQAIRSTKESQRMGNKIVTEADRQATPPPRASASYTPPRRGIGQKLSQERGTATRNEKNPGKRPHQGG